MKKPFPVIVKEILAVLMAFFVAIIIFIIALTQPPTEAPAQQSKPVQDSLLLFKSLVDGNDKVIKQIDSSISKTKVVKPIAQPYVYRTYLNNIIRLSKRNSHKDAASKPKEKKDEKEIETVTVIVYKTIPMRVYGGTPPRELSEREKTDGNFFKGLKPFIKKIFNKNEN